MTAPGESKTGQPLYFERDQRGVEIIPFNPALSTFLDREVPETIKIGRRSWQVHNVGSSFRPNMYTYLKFLDGLAPENLFEQMTKVHYDLNDIEGMLKQMSEDVPGLFGDFTKEYRIWLQLKQNGNPNAPWRSDSIAFRSQVEAEWATDKFRNKRLKLYDSSAYAYLAPNMSVDSPRLLIT